MLLNCIKNVQPHASGLTRQFATAVLESVSFIVPRQSDVHSHNQTFSCQPARRFGSNANAESLAKHQHEVLSSNLQQLKVPLQGAPKTKYAREEFDRQAASTSSEKSTPPAPALAEALASSGYKLDGEGLKVLEKFVGGMIKDGKKTVAQVGRVRLMQSMLHDTAPCTPQNSACVNPQVSINAINCLVDDASQHNMCLQ